MSLAPGSKLGSYEVLSFLGAGGMAFVYRALDTRLEVERAVKVLKPELDDVAHVRIAARASEVMSLTMAKVKQKLGADP